MQFSNQDDWSLVIVMDTETQSGGEFSAEVCPLLRNYMPVILIFPLLETLLTVAAATLVARAASSAYDSIQKD